MSAKAIGPAEFIGMLEEATKQKNGKTQPSTGVGYNAPVKFVRRGNCYGIAPTANFEDTLPLGTYSVGFNPEMGGFILVMSPSFTMPAKIYGDSEKLAERFLGTFRKRQKNTGVLLAGEKGSGKSLMAKLLAIKGIEQKMPTILVNAPFHGEGFNEFLGSITQPCVVLFDEFEKVYQDHQAQQALLTLLDGTQPSNKLFVFTTNELAGIPHTNRDGKEQNVKLTLTPKQRKGYDFSKMAYAYGDE